MEGEEKERGFPHQVLFLLRISESILRLLILLFYLFSKGKEGRKKLPSVQFWTVFWKECGKLPKLLIPRKSQKFQIRKYLHPPQYKTFLSFSHSLTHSHSLSLSQSWIENPAIQILLDRESKFFLTHILRIKGWIVIVLTTHFSCRLVMHV